jgi:hypothetical protein
MPVAVFTGRDEQRKQRLTPLLSKLAESDSYARRVHAKNPSILGNAPDDTSRCCPN